MTSNIQKIDLLLNNGNKLTNLDLGTLNDSQYIKAEDFLINKYKSLNNTTSYNPNTSNLHFALDY